MLKKLANYQPGVQSLWQGRTDSLPGERFFQRVICQNAENQPIEPNHKIAFLGFSCDEGVKRNSGRPGAQQGPDALKAQLAKLPYHGRHQFIDGGNILCTDSDLESAQQQLAELIKYYQHNEIKTVIFGGGHEIAWSHFNGLVKKYPRLGIINFDAHFDLRPLADKKGTSGTPFYQISQYCEQNNLLFSYCCLGIQPHANTTSLFNTASKLNVSYLTAEQITHDSPANQIRFLDKFLSTHEAIYLTICLDVFADCIAPGVSAPQPLGLFPWQTLPLLKYIVQTGKVVSFDIAELSPPWDQEQRTARLAANIAAELIELL
ncbi:formimidoylglutamase [Legionella dresdenensis]|uniref:Formimidoylglutamase n=1 Tax=Legionella dresdenensis TaxID=450200 RepID=A0ABV8CIT5_9GAMM